MVVIAAAKIGGPHQSASGRVQFRNKAIDVASKSPLKGILGNRESWECRACDICASGTVDGDGVANHSSRAEDSSVDQAISSWTELGGKHATVTIWSGYATGVESIFREGKGRMRGSADIGSP